MNLKGKKIVFMGDSITFGATLEAGEMPYWQITGQLTGAVCACFGINGTCIARHLRPRKDMPHEWLSFVDRVNTMDGDADVAVVLGGANDFAVEDGPPIGCIEDRGWDTFYGNLHKLCIQLLERYPQGRIIIMTPLHNAEEDARYKWTGEERRLVSLKDYVTAIREIAEYYSLPVLDLFANAGIQPKIAEQRELFIPDGLHPSQAGHRRIAEMLASFLQNL